jgi:hypothetical protein
MERFQRILEARGPDSCRQRVYDKGDDDKGEPIGRVQDCQGEVAST